MLCSSTISSGTDFGSKIANVKGPWYISGHVSTTVTLHNSMAGPYMCTVDIIFAFDILLEKTMCPKGTQEIFSAKEIDLFTQHHNK